MLPLLIPGAAATRYSEELRGGGGVRGLARRRRQLDGNRGD